LRSQFPNHALLMSDLTRATLALNYEAVSKSVGAGTRTDVWRALSFLLAEYTGADPWAVEQHWPLANIVEEGLR